MDELDAVRTMLSPVGDLILRIAINFEQFRGPVIHIGSQVGVGRGEQAAFRPAPKGGVVFDGQGVEREVLGVQTQGQLYGSLPGSQGLFRQAEDQVQVQVFETRLARPGHALDGFRVGVDRFPAASARPDGRTGRPG